MRIMCSSEYILLYANNKNFGSIVYLISTYAQTKSVMFTTQHEYFVLSVVKFITYFING